VINLTVIRVIFSWVCGPGTPQRIRLVKPLNGVSMSTTICSDRSLSMSHPQCVSRRLGGSPLIPHRCGWKT